MTKAGDKLSALKPSTATARKKASDQARRKLEAERWEASRYAWLNPAMPVVIIPAPAAASVPTPAFTPAPKTRKRTRPQSDRVQQSMQRVYGGMPAQTVKTADAVRAIIEDLRAEDKRLGVTHPDPSRAAIERTLGRRSK